MGDRDSVLAQTELVLDMSATVNSMTATSMNLKLEMKTFAAAHKKEAHEEIETVLEGQQAATMLEIEFSKKNLSLLVISEQPKNSSVLESVASVPELDQRARPTVHVVESKSLVKGMNEG